MKYLSKFKIYESKEEANILNSFFNNKINFELIQDLKDISIEYLDDGWVLYLSVRSDKVGENNRNSMSKKFDNIGRRGGDIFSLIFYHGCSNPDGEWNWNINKRDIDTIISEYGINGLRYEFSIRKRLRGGSESASHHEESMEFLKQIRGLYPEENIILEE